MMSAATTPLPADGPLRHFVFKRHPVVDVLLPPLSQDQVKRWVEKPGGFDQCMRYWSEHERLIREADEDPLRCGFELTSWADARSLLAKYDEVYALGGNGSSKTELGGKLVAEKLCSASGMRVLCVATNEPSSKQLQQAGVYKYLPTGARTMNERTGPRKRDTIKKITYSQAGGFTEGTFVLPNKSQCWFKTAEQYQREPTSFEGPEYDLVWLDEPVPTAMLETLRYRLGKRAGKLFHTFTAIFGFDATCAMVLNGARIVRTLPMNWQWKFNLDKNAKTEGGMDSTLLIPELGLAEEQVKGCPKGHMPYIMQPLDPKQAVIFLWTQWNVFLPRSVQNPSAPAVFDKVQRKSKQTVRMRLYGWAEKLSGCQFPAFNPNVHVISHEKIVSMLKDKRLTTYMASDPATARSYFMLWIGVDKMGRRFIFDESPRVEEGEWVGDDGERGDGTRLYAGRGTNFYKAYIRVREKEHMAQALRRFGDPRAFATQAAAAEGGRSLFELFGECDPDDAENPIKGPMFFEPAKVMRSLLAESTSGSLDKINDAFSYDSEKEISVENEPMLYVSERCQNLIKALLNWDPIQGEKSPWKDPIDVLRYLFGEPLHYADPDVPEILSSKGW